MAAVVYKVQGAFSCGQLIIFAARGVEKHSATFLFHAFVKNLIQRYFTEQTSWRGTNL